MPSEVRKPLTGYNLHEIESFSDSGIENVM